jgi:hypothetical protein
MVAADHRGHKRPDESQLPACSATSTRLCASTAPNVIAANAAATSKLAVIQNTVE